MEQLCRAIQMPGEVIREILTIDADPSFHPDAAKLLDPATWEEGLEELKQEFAPDPKGWKMLCCQLRCAKAAKAEFDRLGFPEQVYFDTMAAFSRFVREHRVSFGTYGFDREFWMVRQVSCRLFRIGQLEYELTEPDGEKIIELHIASDADLSLPALRKSYEAARKLLGSIFPAFQDAPIRCESWLLSQDLQKLLPEQSKIRAFQRSFSVRPMEKAKSDMRLWVFKNSTIPLEQLPEDTSLQRSMKKFLLSGGVFHDGAGTLSTDPFRA